MSWLGVAILNGFSFDSRFLVLLVCMSKTVIASFGKLVLLVAGARIVCLVVCSAS